MESTQERRTRIRVPLEVELCEQAHRGEARVRTRNISELGLCYENSTLAPRRDGDEVILRFCLPGDPQPIQVLGVIADERCLARTSETCVSFVWPRAADAQRIRDYVTSRSSRQCRPGALRLR
ncbi:MAG: PilZ domain-containing protein [Deltaproteobacteria bacterium]|nr:PilZ domain-containing protein [Deltaproteobacteria bacterium]